MATQAKSVFALDSELVPWAAGDVGDEARELVIEAVLPTLIARHGIASLAEERALAFDALVDDLTVTLGRTPVLRRIAGAVVVRATPAQALKVAQFGSVKAIRPYHPAGSHRQA